MILENQLTVETKMSICYQHELIQDNLCVNLQVHLVCRSWKNVWSKIINLSPPPPTPASDRSTKPRPRIHNAAPNNCNSEYRVPRNTQVRTRTHAIVQQSRSVTLVIDEYWYALLTAIKKCE